MLIALVERWGEKRWNMVANGLPGRTGKGCSHRQVCRHLNDGGATGSADVRNLRDEWAIASHKPIRVICCLLNPRYWLLLCTQVAHIPATRCQAPAPGTLYRMGGRRDCAGATGDGQQLAGCAL